MKDLIGFNILQPLEIILNGKESKNITLFIHSFSKCNQIFNNNRSNEWILNANPPNLMRRFRISHKKRKTG